MPEIGFHPPAGGAPDVASLSGGSVIAYTPDTPTQSGWLYAVGVRARRDSTTSPTATIGVYQATSGGTPTDLDQQTASFVVTSGAFAEYVRDLTAAVTLLSGDSQSLAVIAVGGDLGLGMTQAANIPGSDNLLFYWDDAATVLHDAYDVDRSSIEGHLGIWCLFETNVAPRAPSAVSPGATDSTAPQQIGGATPTFLFNFADDNETLPNGLAGDSLKRGRVQVIRQSTGALVWDSGSITADAGEISARQMSIDYTGPSLATGVTYVLRTTVSDRFDAWSPPSADRYFTVGAGRVDTATATPTGKRDTQTPGPFVAVWRHANGLATNAVEVRIRAAGTNALVRSSATLSLAVANNASISVTYATAFGTNVLPWDDARLAWSMRARDTANNWSGWSDDVAFWTDDPPAVPALVLPPNNATVTAPPLLAATCTDTDDTVSTGLLVKFRLKTAAGVAIGTRTATYNAVTKRFEYQCVTGDMTSSFAGYTWDAYAYDGTVYTGGTTVEASAGNSADRAFTYASGPVVAITSPVDGGVITSNTPTIAWTVTGSTQTTRQVTVVRDGEAIHVGIVFATATTTYTLPVVLSTGEQLHHLDDLTITVNVVNPVGLSGSASSDVTLVYTAPPALQPAASLIYGRGDLTPSVVRVSWPQSDQDVDAFRYYRLTRTISADMLAANPTLPKTPVNFGRLAIGQHSFDDHEASAGVSYTYAVKQFVLAGIDTIGSATRTTDITVLFENVLIHDTRDPALRRVVFDARRDRTITSVTDFAVVSPWNQQKPVQFESDVYYKEYDLTLVLTAKSVQAANYDLWIMEQQVIRGGVLCYRDGRGNIAYGRWSSGPVVSDPPGGRLRTVRGVFRELAYDPSSED